MASTSAIYGVPDLSVYSATKHAVCALTEAWDIELEKDGVVVSDILAPYVKTPLLDVPEDVYSIEKMGVKLAPSNIAQTVWKAVHGKKLHWWVGGATYALFGLFWLMPFIRRFVIKSLTIKPK
jgi:short-subunit dehydrogenase